MENYKSSKSLLVKIITIVLSIVFLMTISLTFFSDILGIWNEGYLLTLIVCLIALVAYLKSLISVSISLDSLVLNHNFGKKVIKLENILSIKKVPNANFVFTFGSNGFFGFNGFTLDGSICYINDRNQIIQICTPEKTYLISCDESILKNEKLNLKTDMKNCP